jgi:capsular polysaccharide transport system permease protein
LEGQIAVKQTELNTLKAVKSDRSPQVLSAENELLALKAQLITERNKLSQSGKEELPVSEILAKFTDYKVKMELALQAYT